MTKAAPPNGMHTAGIYSDMTVDGPVIGTLVIIVDRAKNLPNRKSIGKQDPYCAARLGKEAKKTETDRRGGQTPKWDQELRFTVHDSPDYYQLKVSVFNDDKKTDLIGETWVNLQDVVVPGGGQNDLWHNLAYRGKYAGEIRIEMTYYDSRPKQEKPSEKTRQTAQNGAVDTARDQMTGPRQPKPSVKRRPLPADPTATSPSPATIPDHTQVSPKGYQTPTSYVHAQSPLQSVEYNTPQKFSQSQQDYGSTRGSINEYSTPPAMAAGSHVGRPRPDDRYESYDPVDGHQVNAGSRRGRYQDQVEDQRMSSHSPYDMQEMAHELPVPQEYDPPLSPGGPPPLPPKHRSNQASSVFSAPPLHLNTIRTVPYEALPQDNYRHSMPEHGQNTTYQAYSPMRPQELQASYPGQNAYQDGLPRHRSYDERSSESYRSMQPTVEDDISSSPTPYPSQNDCDPHVPQYDDRAYDQIPPTAPLNLSGRGSASSGNYSASGTSSYSRPPPSVSPVSYRDPYHLDSDVSSQTSYGHHSHKDYGPRSQSDDQMILSSSGYVPSIPPTLVAGMDPVIAQEVSERIYTENRASYSQAAGSARNRYSQQPQHRYSHAQPHRQQEASGPFVPAAVPSSAPLVPAAANYEDLQSYVAINSYTPVVKPRALSPDPRVPPRKSISPSPIHSLAHSASGRRLSGIPFGPDAYEALNPAVNTTPAQSQMIAKFGSPVLPGQHDNSDPGAKIIMHDGREVDPSDHLPEASWAPEPEARGSKQVVNAYGRGAQSAPSSGPRPLRLAGRPYSMVAPASSPHYPTDGYSGPSTPTSNAGRTRLQKKANRSSMAPGSAPQSSPLALVSSHEEDHFAPRSLQKAHTMDFSGDHGYRLHGNSRGDYYDAYRQNNMNGPPPVPAKIPMNHGPPMPPTENAWNLLEEMKTIDLGVGRARRRGHAAA